MKVTLICHGVITVDPRNETAWEDVWVKFRHKSKRYSYGPTLIGRADLDGELEMSEELQEEHKNDPECD